MRNFQTEEPLDHAEYYHTQALSCQSWTVDEQLAVVGELTEQDLREFIPRLLASLNIECLVYGNCSPDIACQLYRKLSDKLRMLIGHMRLLRKRALG